MCCGARRLVERRACGCTTWGGRVCVDMGVGVWCVHAGRWSAACDGGMVGQGVAVVASPRGGVVYMWPVSVAALSTCACGVQGS